MAQLGIVARRRLELPSNEALVDALKRGYGIAAISRYVVAAELRIGSLVLRVRDAKLTPPADRFHTYAARLTWPASEDGGESDIGSVRG